MIYQCIDFGTPHFDELVGLRKRVLRDPLGREFSEEEIAREWKDLHVAVLNDSYQIIAGAMLRFVSQGIGQVKQICVEPSLQGQGRGTRLNEYVENVARAQGYQAVILHARQEAVAFYLRNGYQVVGEPFDEIGIPHFEMSKMI